MKRTFTNHIAGQRRIHIEITEDEIADLLDSLDSSADASEATKRLAELLRQSDGRFARDRQHEAQTSRT